MKRKTLHITLSLFALLFLAALVPARADAYADELFNDLPMLSADGFTTVFTDLDGELHTRDGVPDVDRLPLFSQIERIASYQVLCGGESLLEVKMRGVSYLDPDTAALLETSGASLKSNGYYDTEFDLLDGAHYAYITGLTQDTLLQVQSELMDASLNDRTFRMENLKFIDAEKEKEYYYDPSGDTELCWAATSANMLWYTGWAQAAGFEDVDAVLEDFIDCFDDCPGNPYYGIYWFLTGNNQKQGDSNWAQIDNNFDRPGYFPQIADEDKYDTVYYLRVKTQEKNQNIIEVFDLLKQGYAAGLTLGWYYDRGTFERGGGHMVTLWGYVAAKNPSASFNKADYPALLVTDSDSDKNTDNRRTAPNRLRLLPMEPFEDTWRLGYRSNDDYYESIPLLDGITVLRPYVDPSKTPRDLLSGTFEGHGNAISWTYNKSTRRVSLLGAKDLSGTVCIAAYNESGRMVNIFTTSASGSYSTKALDKSAVRVKLIWLDKYGIPQVPAEVISLVSR
ncbi:MAG: hypothetical protein E7425_08590 [Ruminococcaceae bacterium]|nr:hypothetical protein [Oscillospiraceae bacterium]